MSAALPPDVRTEPVTITRSDKTQVRGEGMTMPHTQGTYASARRRDVLVGVLTLLLPVAVILVTGALASGRRLM